uniref:Bm273 n=1 Tax=Brugia malayi TaxID=6279 RepID=A0A1I9GCX9_BRUMA|nr:Bm273 [Brugia malayi]
MQSSCDIFSEFSLKIFAACSKVIRLILCVMSYHVTLQSAFLCQMPEKPKDFQTTKLEKFDKHMNKPIQAIKKLKDHFHKLSKKNKSVTTGTILPVTRTVDNNTSKTTNASRTTDTSRSVIFHSVESTRNNESSHESFINRNVEQVESHVRNIFSIIKMICNVNLLMTLFLHNFLNFANFKSIKIKSPVEVKVENLSDNAIEQQLASLNQ